MSYIYPVILSGGVGTRLWPLSRSDSPKQLLRLAGEHSLIQETALRTVSSDFAKPLIICSTQHRFAVAEQMRTIDLKPSHIILEPVGRNTAPAAAVAAMTIAKADPDALILLMPADHQIQDRTAFLDAVATARYLAERGYLVTLGVHAEKPETGYGYIQRGPSLPHTEKGFSISRFVEKPDAMTADRYVKAGDYYWNSGIFMFRARTYLAELQRLTPDIVANCGEAIGKGISDSDFFQLDRETFDRCQSISIDYAVMEHTDKGAIVPVEMGWSDIGSWAALWDRSDKDTNGNVSRGAVIQRDSHGSYLHSEGPLIAALGVRDIVVVATPDAVLVCAKSMVQDVKKVVEQLERNLRDGDRKII